MASTASWFDDPQHVLAVLQGERRERTRLPELPDYEIVRELGRGGQGIVFLALHKSTRQPAAIKVLLDGIYASAARRQRFERELEVVAALQHARIARILGSGLTSDGRPYLALEFVDGKPLDQWLSAQFPPAGTPPRRSDIRRVVQLLIDICEAVNFAHQHGVIHRDLKPGNILIDAPGQPHVLDFGLARPAEAAVMTHTGEFFGSLPWTSPEQVRGDRAAISIRSDVYSLGVMLYQALTGRLPCETSGGMQQATHNIVFAEPPRPHEVNPEIDSDLQAVALRALEKQPARRYQTAGELAADLQAWMSGKPVQARADSGWYLIRKAMRRHRLPLGIAGCMLVVGFGYALTVSVLLRETTQARNRAEAALARTAKVNDFLGEILTAVDPSRSGYRVTLAEVLDRAEAEARRRFAAEPEIDASISLRLGESFENLGEYARGIADMRRAFETRREILGESHPDTLEAMGKYLTAGVDVVPDRKGLLTQFRRYLELMKAADPRSKETINARLLMAQLLQREPGGRSEQDRLLQEAEDAAREAFGDSSPTQLTILGSRAEIETLRGQYSDAERHLREIIQIRSRGPDPENQYLLAAKLLLGRVLVRRGDPLQAEQVTREAYEVQRRILGATHPAEFGSVCVLAECKLAEGECDAARQIIADLIDSLLDNYPPDDFRLHRAEEIQQIIESGIAGTSP